MGLAPLFVMLDWLGVGGRAITDTIDRNEANLKKAPIGSRIGGLHVMLMLHGIQLSLDQIDSTWRSR